MGDEAMLQRFGHYEIDTLIGQGGMGEVYRAHDTRRDRDVALKLLPDAISQDPEYQRRFRRESFAVARLREPHIVPIHDYGDIDGRLYIDMRLVDGRSLTEVLARDGALTTERAVGLISQVADALDAAHADGLVHRDIKPSNVLVTDNDFVYVVDFGLALSVGSSTSRLTMTGVTLGTLDYMAPERFENRAVDCRTDVYSLACMLFECLTGEKPFPGDDLPAQMYAHLYLEPRGASASNPTVPAELDAVVARGMAKFPEGRFTTAGELAAAARKALTREGRPVPVAAVPPAEPVAGAAGAVAAPGPVTVAPQAEQAVHPQYGPAGAPGRGGGSPIPAQHAAEPATATVVGAGAVRAGAGPVTHANPPGGGYGAPFGADGSHGVPPGTPPGAPPPAGPPPGGGGRSRRPLLIAGIALVAVVAIVVALFAFGVLGTGSGSSGVGGGSTTGTSTLPVANSIAKPTVGETVPVGPTPGYMEIAPNGKYGYIAQRGAQTISVFDTTRNAVTATIPVPDGGPQFVAFSPDGAKAYVSVFNNDYSLNEVAVVDTASAQIVARVPTGKRPFALDVTPDGKKLYVPNHDSGSITVIDTDSNTVINTLQVAPNPHWVDISPDGKFLFAANHESNLITTIDLANDSVVRTTPVGKSPHSIVRHPKKPIVINANYDDSTVSVTDANTGAVLATVPTESHPQDVTLSADGKYAYLATVDANAIQVLDTTSYQITATLPVGKGPTSVAVGPDGRQAYVTNLLDGSVTILNIAGTA